MTARRSRWLCVAVALVCGACATVPSDGEAEPLESPQFSHGNVVVWPFTVSIDPAPDETTRDTDWSPLAATVEYPEFPRRAGIEGVLSVSVVVSPEGRVVGFEPGEFARVGPSSTPDRMRLDLRDRFATPTRAALLGAEVSPAPARWTVVDLAVAFHLDR